jgi:hypothetical protein
MQVTACQDARSQHEGNTAGVGAGAGAGAGPGARAGAGACTES